MIDTVANLLMIGIRSILIIPFVPFVLERIANERHAALISNFNLLKQISIKAVYN